MNNNFLINLIRIFISSLSSLKRAKKEVGILLTLIAIAYSLSKFFKKKNKTVNYSNKNIQNDEVILKVDENMVQIDDSPIKKDYYPFTWVVIG